jgi:hypothetical protein
MPIYELTKDQIRTVTETSFGKAGLRERSDLQRLLRGQIQIVSPDTLVIAKEFGEWEDSRRRIDLLGLDKNANLVVIELKRTDDGGHMELQAIRYAAMVSQMTFDQAVEAYGAYLEAHGRDEDAQEAILNFLDWEEPNEDQFAQDVRLVLVSGEFSKETTTAVMWLNERGLDIRCVRLKPYNLDGRTLLDVQQVIPLPEAAEYQIQLREKRQQERKARAQTWDEASFMAELEKTAGHRAVELAKSIQDWIVPLVDEITWGTTVGRLDPRIHVDGSRVQVFSLRTNARVGVRFMLLRRKPPFDDRQERQELLRRFNEIPGLGWLPKVIDGKPNFPLELLADPVGLEKFKNAIEWMLHQFRNPNKEVARN